MRPLTLTMRAFGPFAGEVSLEKCPVEDDDPNPVVVEIDPDAGLPENKAMKAEKARK